ncbi:hypothetical protein [Actinomadura macra]|uniref:hypothetical protein n=1 Tax=Actinomadura macra TaxID=46164 RepID=UPI000A8EBE8F|nr:hypothetical protein [Actinomadura macra]
MAGESISLDDLIAQQEQQGLSSIVEAVADRPDHVKITPYVVGVGPLRAHAFVVPKDAVESVTGTEESSTCCDGKESSVVELTFADPILNDVLRQLSRAFPREAPWRAPHPGSRPHRQVRADGIYCDIAYQECFGHCQREYPYGSKEFNACADACGAGYWHCLGHHGHGHGHRHGH